MKPGKITTSYFTKFLVVAFLSLVAQLIQSPGSQAASTPNGTCASAGKSTTIAGDKYICTKVGKKLIWSKAAVLPASTTIAQKLEAISDDIKLKLRSAKSEVDLSLNIDPLLSKSQWSKDSVASIPTATKLLSVLGVKPINQMKIYISWGTEYRSQFTPSYCQNASGGGLCGQTGIIFADLKWFADTWGYGGVEAPYKWEMDEFTIKANLQHEIGHYGQEESAAGVGNKDYWKYEPGWLREGVAEYFKLLTSAYDGKVSYTQLHNMYLKNSGTQRCLKYSLLEMSKQDFNSDGCEYAKGLFAAEYLVAKTGRVDSIYAMDKIAGTDTASIFAKAYGFSFQSFCTEADAYFAKITANLK